MTTLILTAIVCLTIAAVVLVWRCGPQMVEAWRHRTELELNLQYKLARQRDNETDESPKGRE